MDQGAKKKNHNGEGMGGGLPCGLLSGFFVLYSGVVFLWGGNAWV